jgi:aspartate aminotransferase-like enzyme
VVGIAVPERINAKALLSCMSARHKVEISGSFGANIVRIGQMGEQCRAHNLFRTLHALGTSMNALGQRLDLPLGMAALEARLANLEQPILS